MNELKIFESPEFGRVRTTVVNGKPYFVGKDIAEAMGYQNGSRDINRHVDDDDRLIISLSDGKQNRDTIVVNESGLYSLLLSSKLPTAKQFKRWVTSEVLPTIRKTDGGYMTPEMAEKALLNPDFIIGLATQIKKLQRENSHQKQLIAGFSDELSLAEMRQVINRVVRKVANYAARWNELYKQFDMKHHMNVRLLAKRRNLGTLDYIESIEMLPALFSIACKLYESEVDKLVQEIYGLRSA